MLHITCDLCGKELRSGEDHYVVKIEVFATHDPAKLTEADLDEDHMEAVSELLREVEEGEEGEELEPVSRRMRYDLCPDCRQRYLCDPLRKDAAPPAGKEAAQKFDFSEN
jgi:CRISPR/Cas system-associated exonuclease Cas4 (RecB family)